jgi:hypothetical protein
MLPDQNTRSQRAARQLTAAIGIVSPLISCRWPISDPVLIAATAVVGLIAYSMAATGMGDGAITVLRAGHLDNEGRYP